MGETVKIALNDGKVVSKPLKEAVIMEAKCEGQIVGGRPVYGGMKLAPKAEKKTATKKKGGK